MPFGFALSRFFREHGKSLLKSLVVTVAVGAMLSYSIEMIQLYMPTRDSAWDDVLANTFGALAGAVFALASGGYILRILSESERHLEQSLSLRKILIAALIYFGLWFAASIPLQRKARLDNWDPNSSLVIGHDVQDGSSWSGKVSRVQIWDRALSSDQAIGISGNSSFRDEFTAKPNSNLLAFFDFSQRPPIVNKAGLLGNLPLEPFVDHSVDASWPAPSKTTSAFMSEVSVPALTAAVRRSNQISVLVGCVPRRGDDRDGAIFGIANLSGKSNLVLWQDQSDLVLILRNGLDSGKSELEWRRAGVFAARVPRSIVFSYDGARGSVYVDGKKEPKSYNFSPGAALVGELIRVKTDELVAYSGLYDSLVFLPVGFLLGLAFRITPRRNTVYRAYLYAGVLLPAFILEALLVAITGRNGSLTQVSVSIGLTIAGIIWMNLDRAKFA
jgi:glycopeptide antibiotics resistance protein